MRIFVHQQSIELTAEQREYVAMRVKLALGRFVSPVLRVDVYLADTNGHRRGIDKRCRFVAKVQGSKDVLVEDEDSDFYVLIDRATERLGRAVSRRIERRRLGGLRVASHGSQSAHESREF